LFVQKIHNAMRKNKEDKNIVRIKTTGHVPNHYFNRPTRRGKKNGEVVFGAGKLLA